MRSVHGIHHVTAITSDLARNVDFYARTLGLRLVKQTVNFDDPRTVHLYYGDEAGSPGSLITFFVWTGAYRGRQGTGQAAVTSVSVVPGAIGFWIERLMRHGIRFEGPTTRGSGADLERVLALADPDGLMLEIVGHAGAESRAARGGADDIPHPFGIRGLHGVTLWVERGDATERVLVDTLGFRARDEDDNARRFAAGDGGPGSLVTVRSIGGFVTAEEGAGTAHHVAWRAADLDALERVREQELAAGLTPTGVLDRNYFRSVYVREPGGVLFEVATDGPGFAIDEPLETLGRHFVLPPWLEPRRAELEATLPRVQLPGAGAAGSAFSDPGPPNDTV